MLMLPSNKGNSNKPELNFYLIPVRIAHIQETSNNTVGEDVRRNITSTSGLTANLNSHYGCHYGEYLGK